MPLSAVYLYSPVYLIILLLVRIDCCIGGAQVRISAAILSAPELYLRWPGRSISGWRLTGLLSVRGNLIAAALHYVCLGAANHLSEPTTWHFVDISLLATYLHRPSLLQWRLNRHAVVCFVCDVGNKRIPAIPY